MRILLYTLSHVKVYLLGYSGELGDHEFEVFSMEAASFELDDLQVTTAGLRADSRHTTTTTTYQYIIRIMYCKELGCVVLSNGSRSQLQVLAFGRQPTSHSGLGYTACAGNKNETGSGTKRGQLPCTGNQTPILIRNIVIVFSPSSEH